MAADDQRKGQRKYGRVGPSVDASRTSRVSRAAGSIGSESMRVEQRSNTPATKQSSKNPVPARRSQGQGDKQSSKKATSAKRLYCCLVFLSSCLVRLRSGTLSLCLNLSAASF